jgi:hypothetical protein
MAKIEDAAFQAEIADSLLGEQPPQESSEAPPQEQGYFGDSDAVALLDSAIEDQRTDRLRFGDSIAEEEPSNEERLASLETDRTDWQSERKQREAQEDWESRMFSPEEAQQLMEQQQAEQQPQTIEQGLQELNATVERFQLNDRESAKGLATELCEAFGTDLYKSNMNVEVLGSTMAKTVLSAARIYDQNGGDVSKLGPIHPEAAKAWLYDFAKSWGVDARVLGNVDAQLAAQTVLSGVWNIFSTYQRLGTSDVSRLNDPQMAVQAVTAFNRAFGDDSPVTVQQAVKIADAFAKYVIGFLGRVQKHAQPQQQAQQQAARGSRRGQRAPRVAGGRVSGMRTNQDKNSPFNRETIDYYKQQHGRL